MDETGYGRAVNTAFDERRSELMHSFRARNPRQLDICLRMLYADGIPFHVRIEENERQRIEYVISIHSDEDAFLTLLERYRILVS
jgi:hypothetical protein